MDNQEEQYARLRLWAERYNFTLVWRDPTPGEMATMDPEPTSDSDEPVEGVMLRLMDGSLWYLWERPSALGHFLTSEPYEEEA